MRVDHWVKNVFVLPGYVVALAAGGLSEGLHLDRLALALLAVGLVASSNYVLNELLDAPFDRHHPDKRHRPVPSGRVSTAWAWAQWLALGAAGLAVAWPLHPGVGWALVALWGMGLVYNVPPVRSKEQPYLDVLSEAINNPIRLLVGWYAVAPSGIPSGALLASYWFVGAYFMALKRFAELRELDDPERAARYRRSLGWYDEPRLLVSIVFHAAAAMLFFGAFAIRYRLELVLCFPLVAWVMATYMWLAFQPDSPVRSPERLYRATGLVVALLVCALAIGVLLFVDLPWLEVALAPTMAF